MNLRWRLPWFDQVRQDVRYALRQFGRAKGFTIVVVLTLAVGIGATTAIYSVVDTVLFHPIPGAEADRFVQVGEWTVFSNRTTPEAVGLSPMTGEALAATGREFFADVGWSDDAKLDRKGEEFRTMVYGAAVSENFFALFGARPALGRGFAPGEAVRTNSGTPERGTTIVLSDAWWRADFGADPKVLGQTVELSGQRFTIVGVMPAHFQFPRPGVKCWLPAESPRPQPRSMGAANLRLIARLRPGVTLAQTQAMLDTVAQRLMQDHPAGDRSYGDYWRAARRSLSFWVRPLEEMIQSRSYSVGFDELRRTLLGFFAAIGFVLAIVCANIASLTVARTERREHELAVRVALGAGRARLTRQLLTENLLLALAGGLAGLGFTHWAIKVLVAFNTMPRLRPIAIDARVFGIALVVALVTGLLFGLLPAWRAGRIPAGRALAQSGYGASTGGRGSRVQAALVVVEVALAVVLLTGAGLMIRSVVRLLRVDPGFDPVNLVTAAPDFTGPGGITREKRQLFLNDLQGRIAAMPGVTAVGLFKDVGWEKKYSLADRPEPVLLGNANAGVEAQDYFRAARIPLVAGRLLGRGDVGKGLGTVVVNETLAELCWPGQSAIGKTFRATEPPGTVLYEVVGVVRDSRTWKPDEVVRPTFYRPFAEAEWAGAPDKLVIRTQRDPAALIPALRAEIRALQPNLRQPWFSVVQQELFDATQPQRTFRNYLAIFAGAGLLLACLGIYGVLAYAVARRTREIGIRMALGADRGRVTGDVMREGARLIALGGLTGLVVAFWLTQLLQKQLFGVSPHDVGVQAAVVATLAAVGLIACWLPARRAAKVDPMVALRCE